MALTYIVMRQSIDLQAPGIHRNSAIPETDDLVTSARFYPIVG